MMTSTIMAMGVADLLAAEHQRELRAAAERAHLARRYGKSTGFATLRATAGRAIIRAGGWVAGRDGVPALVGRPARA